MLTHSPRLSGFRTFLIRVGAILLTGVNGAVAAVVWDKTVVARDVSIEDDRVEFQFPFRVTDKSVSLAGLEIPCGCAQAQADKPQYKPGDKGVFSVVFLVEDRVGVHDMDIPVRDSLGTDYTLTIRPNIPILLRPSTKLVSWTKDNNNATQTVRCAVLPPYRVHEARLEISHPSIRASIPRVHDSGFEIDVALADAEYSKPVKISVVTDLPVPRQSRLVLWSLNRTR